MMLKRYFVIALLVALTAYTYVLRFRDIVPPPIEPLSTLPLRVGEYTGIEETIDAETLDALRADETVYREYRGPSGRPVWLFLGYFGAPQENSQVHSPKHCYPGSGWNIYHESSVDVPFGGHNIHAKGLLITDGQTRQCVVYWFHTDSGVITNEYALKWDQMKSSLLRRSQKSTFIRVSTIIAADEDQTAATQELRGFIDSLAPYLISALDGKRRKVGSS